MTTTAMLRFTIVFLSLLPFTASQKFEPYQLNGGLVAAIAGKNYCLLAGDTRMMDGGYQIYTRNLMRMFGLRGKELPLPEVNEEILVTSGGSTLIAAAGCQSDCNALQRQLNFQVKAHDDDMLETSNVAQLLSSTLYSRRSFPYYSFCVVGGIDDAGGSKVYVYDAIGSMEQVAVGTAGTGRELLQPILDRLFSSSSGITVDCSSEEAVALLTQAYHAVTERDIGVGDSLVLCLLTCSGDGDDDDAKCRIIRVPLKKH